jgi:hypothetical protein
MSSLTSILAILVMAFGTSSYALSAEPSPAPMQSGTIIAVGPGQLYKSISDAALEAHSGDTVRIFPGTYTDCAIWSQNDLTIEGAGDGVVVANRACDGKAIFVINGDNVTVKLLTFSGAEVPDHNGAGIKAEGGNLMVDNVKFIDNEEGILAHLREGAALIVRDSLFQGNGNCVSECAHGLYVSQATLLHVEHSEFVGQHVGHHIKSRAMTTEVIDNFIHDGPQGNASYLVDVPNGGKITITGNRFEKGPHAENSVAISIAAEQNQPQHDSTEANIENNDFTNDSGLRAVFVRNQGAGPLHVYGNRIEGGGISLVGDGTVGGAPE